MKPKTIFYPTILALTTALISGTNNFLTKIAVNAVKDPIFFTTLKNGLVALILISLLVALKKWPEIKALTKKQWGKLILIGIIGGSIPFALFFTGLTKTSALNASLIHKTLFLWVLIFAVPLLKERIHRWQWAGIGAIFAANLLIGGFQGFKFNIGELMILAATILWAAENIIAKRVLKDVSALTVAASRMVFGSVILLVLVAWRGNIGMLSGLNSQQWGWTMLTGVLLFGYVLTWYTALKHAPATYVAILLVPATLVTNILSTVFITHVMPNFQLVSSGLYLLGLLFVIWSAKRTIFASQSM